MQLIETRSAIITAPSIITQIWAVVDEFVNTVEEQNKQATKENRLKGTQKVGRVIDLFKDLFPTLNLSKIVKSVEIVLELVIEFIELIVKANNKLGVFTHD